MPSTLYADRRRGRIAVVALVARDVVDGGPPRLGGAAFYAAQALRLLRAPAIVATKFAESERALAAPLHRLGLPVAARTAPVTAAFRIDNRPDGSRSLALERRGDPWTAADVEGWLRPVLAGAGWVHAGALTRADFTVEALAALARGRRVCLDGQGLTRPDERGPVALDAAYDPELLRHVSVLKLSEEEAGALGLGLDARSLIGLGVGEVVVTLGHRGAYVAVRGAGELVPTVPLQGIDPTGSGDMFTAAYLVYRQRGHAPVPAAGLANRVAYALLAERSDRRAYGSRNSPRATTTAEPPTSTASMRSADPETRA